MVSVYSITYKVYKGNSLIALIRIFNSPWKIKEKTVYNSSIWKRRTKNHLIPLYNKGNETKPPWEIQRNTPTYSNQT